MIRIVSARWKYTQHWPTLEVETADGETLLVWPDQKPEVLEQDAVCVDARADWLLKLPRVTVLDEVGDEAELGGFVKDPRLATLTRELIAATEAGEFAPRLMREADGW
jgi:hypothetical protein